MQNIFFPKFVVNFAFIDGTSCVKEKIIESKYSKNTGNNILSSCFYRRHFFSNIVYNLMNHFMERDHISCRCKCDKRILSK